MELTFSSGVYSISRLIYAEEERASSIKLGRLSFIKSFSVTIFV